MRWTRTHLTRRLLPIVRSRICLLKLRQEDLPFKAPSRRFAFEAPSRRFALKFRQKDICLRRVLHQKSPASIRPLNYFQHLHHFHHLHHLHHCFIIISSSSCSSCSSSSSSSKSSSSSSSAFFFPLSLSLSILFFRRAPAKGSSQKIVCQYLSAICKMSCQTLHYSTSKL